jgi:hypothetical protein
VDHLDAVHVRQAEVEDDQVRRVLGGKFKRLASGSGGVHLVVADAQVDAQGADDLRLIVDDQDGSQLGSSSAE